MPKRSGQLDDLFHALADPTRRAIIERLGQGPAPTSELARPFEMALPSFTQHLDVLEACGVVHSRKLGRVRTYRLTDKPLEPAEDWLAARRAQWTQRLDQLNDFLETKKE